MADYYELRATYHTFFCYSILFLSSHPSVYAAQAAAKVHHVAKMESLAPEPSTSFSSAHVGDQQFPGVERAHKQEPCSPIEMEKSAPGSRQILLEIKIGSLSSTKAEVYGTDEYGEGIRLPLTPTADSSFAVPIEFGTPKRNFLLLFDTGSDTTWLQCQPCSAGCNSSVPSFDPSSSSTFANATCESPNCAYFFQYNDGTYSKGYFANDTLTLLSNKGFVFGCAREISGDFGGTSGVLGIGQGKYSLLAQTDNHLFSVFCYCLPATESSTGFLVFGVQAFETCQPDSSKMIPLVVKAKPGGKTGYFVSFTGITIGQQRLDISSYTSSPPNTIIDSGTVITRLPPLIYEALISAFQSLMSQYPTAHPSPLLDKCYNLQDYHNWTPPNMVLHFANSIDVELDKSAVITRESDSQFCFAFARNSDPNGLTIIGNQQHRELSVLYDINGAKLAFGTGGCAGAN